MSHLGMAETYERQLALAAAQILFLSRERVYNERLSEQLLGQRSTPVPFQQS